ncbi:MAG: hypothetical protein ACRC8S_06135 [Fimbriiglobus sp.]
MRVILGLMVWCCGVAQAGVYYSREEFRTLPAKWSGFLPDQRMMRNLGNPKAAIVPPLRTAYQERLAVLVADAKKRPLTADETADLGALHLRLGEPIKALAILRPASRKWPEHFALAANLGTAWHLTGDLDQAALTLEEAVRLAPEKHRAVESLHLKLVRQRSRDPKGTGYDDLFGVEYVGESGKPEAGKLAAAQAKKLPTDALVQVQALAMSLPNDGRLLWQLGELANASGDFRTAANILEGCVSEFALSSPDVRRRREIYREAVDRVEKAEKHVPEKSTIVFRSIRPLVTAVDLARLPQVRKDEINDVSWVVFAETELSGSKLKFLPYVEQLDGLQIRLTGYMLPGGPTKEGELMGFVFTENPIGCWFCESPGPYQTLAVELSKGLAEPTRQAIKVVGRFKLNRADPEQYPFRLVDAKVLVDD